MNFHPSLQHKNQLVELWEQSWGSMQDHVTAPQEIHRKVLRMVSPLTEQDAKLMLRLGSGEEVSARVGLLQPVKAGDSVSIKLDERFVTVLSR